MWIIKHRKLFYIFSVLLVAASVLMLVRFGLNLGTDFTGGTILEVEYSGARPTPAQVGELLTTGDFDSSAFQVQPAGENGVILRARLIDEAEHQSLLQALETFALAYDGQMTEKRFSSVGPALGQELARKGVTAMVLVVGLLLLYIAFVFRKVSIAGSARGGRGVNSWVYGLVLVVSMIHDVIIPTGVFAYLGYYYGVETDALFLTAFLTILGLSVNDKIVAFDRIRENLRRQQTSEKFDETVGRSLSETLTRSINTSVTVLLVLLALFFFGSDSTKYFALAMALGMIVATYCSIFIAAPLLVTWHNWRTKTSV